MSCELGNTSNKINKNYLTILLIELLTVICTFVDIDGIIKLLLVHSIFSFIKSSKNIFTNLFKSRNKYLHQLNTIVIQHGSCFCTIGIMKINCLYHYWKHYLFNFQVVYDMVTFEHITNKLNLDLILRNLFLFDTTWYIFYKCKLFCALSRTLSFQPLQKIEAINLYSINLESRTLNFYEKQIFSSVQIVPNGINYNILSINNNCSKFQLNNKEIFIYKFTKNNIIRWISNYFWCSSLSSKEIIST